MYTHYNNYTNYSSRLSDYKKTLSSKRHKAIYSLVGCNKLHKLLGGKGNDKEQW